MNECGFNGDDIEITTPTSRTIMPTAFTTMNISQILKDGTKLNSW